MLELISEPEVMEIEPDLESPLCRWFIGQGEADRKQKEGM